MARPLRIELAGAPYHVTARGNERRAIFLGDLDADRGRFLGTLAETVDRFNWVCHAYCPMTNHYHFVIETPDANLSKGMRQWNGVYTQGKPSPWAGWALVSGALPGNPGGEGRVSAGAGAL
jgi:REP-associated tyrosine transposase